MQLPGDELFTPMSTYMARPRRSVASPLIELIWSRRIDPGKVFDLTLPLDQANDGYRATEERRAIKTLLTASCEIPTATDDEDHPMTMNPDGRAAGKGCLRHRNGIGRATAVAFAREGASVVAVASEATEDDSATRAPNGQEPGRSQARDAQLCGQE